MQREGGPFQTWTPSVPVLFSLLAMAMTGCASAPARTSSALPIEVSAPPTGCQRLGEVKAEDDQYNLKGFNKAHVQNAAFDKAADLGATHVQIIYLGEVGNYRTGCEAIAYRCPAGDAPSQMK